MRNYYTEEDFDRMICMPLFGGLAGMAAGVCLAVNDWVRHGSTCWEDWQVFLISGGVAIFGGLIVLLCQPRSRS